MPTAPSKTLMRYEDRKPHEVAFSHFEFGSAFCECGACLVDHYFVDASNDEPVTLTFKHGDSAATLVMRPVWRADDIGGYRRATAIGLSAEVLEAVSVALK